VGTQHHSITSLLHRIEEHIEQWRREDAARKAEAEANRERLWAEARERERLLKEAVNRREGENKPLEEVAREQGTVFVVHSEEAGKVLEEFAARGGRLVRVIPGAAESLQGGAGISGSWLIFDGER